MKKMNKKRTFVERGWNDSLDLPRYLRRGLSGMYVFHKFPGEDKATPTCLEDCAYCTIRGWLIKEGDVEMAKRTLENLEGTFDRLLQYLHEDEVKMVNKVIDERGDKPELGKEPVLFEVVDAVLWYCNTITLIADVFGVCSPGSEAQIAYDERLERRKSQKS
ncbi:hypothetical protein [Paramuribaculum intestinale]|uniref:hypothetical protein n=2 Tax=Muribaculaceae TaxID=2005473 RepID=UPI0026E46BE8|nr:hypothetical protein [Paramuribaculum intestinale]